MLPVIDLRAAHEELAEDLTAAFNRVREGGSYILGAEVETFEREFASYCGAAHCVGVGNGFDAIQLLLRAAGVGPGDEVVVPAYTAVATWMAVSAVGAVPIGVDIDHETWTLDPARMLEALTERTRAVLPVHLFGLPADIDAIRQLADDHGLLCFEDAAQAHGARSHGRRVGALAQAAAFSFYPTKNLGALGDGGAVVTDDDELADRVRLLRSYGWRDRSESQVKGLNSRLDELHAALLRVKLRHLDAWNARRRRLAKQYLADLPAEAISLPISPPSAEHVWHLFVVGVPDSDAFRSSLATREIQTLVHYVPLPHLTDAYRGDGWRPGMFPVAEALSQRAVSLPMYPQLSDADCSRVIDAVREVAADAVGARGS